MFDSKISDAECLISNIWFIGSKSYDSFEMFDSKNWTPHVWFQMIGFIQSELQELLEGLMHFTYNMLAFLPGHIGAAS